MSDKKKSSICQTCFNFDCNWHEKFEPVDGWTATPTHINNYQSPDYDSYLVEKCPLYRKRSDTIWYKRVTQKEIAKVSGINMRSAIRAIANSPKITTLSIIEKAYDDLGYDFYALHGVKRMIYYIVKKGAPQYIIDRLLNSGGQTK